MANIVAYFNTFLDLIFGTDVFRILTPSNTLAHISAYSEASSSLEHFLLYVLGDPSVIFSCFVWAWFAVLTVNLLLIFPYKWIRSLIRKCGMH